MTSDEFYIMLMFVVVTAWTVIYSPLCIKGWSIIKKYYLDIAKIWSISLNSNNGLATVKLVHPTADGLKAHKHAGGYEVPTEFNYMFSERTAGNKVAVWDEDTGLLLRPYAGEIEMGDPAVNRSRELGIAIDNMQKNGGVDWGFIAVILAIVIIVGLIIIGVVLAGIA